MKQLTLNYEKPLYHKKENVMVLWQAKAGCTMVKKMFFYHEKKLEEILKKHPWIHNFNYSEYSIKIPNENTKIIQFVRCPFERAVSSYIHVQRTYLKSLFKCDDNISFREFLLNIIKAIPNNHYGKQITDYKNVVSYKIEQINENVLQEIYKNYGLIYKNFDSPHYAKRKKIDGFIGDKSWSEIKNSIPEKYTYFYDEVNKKLVEKLYHDDILTFDYSYEEFLNRNT